MKILIVEDEMKAAKRLERMTRSLLEPEIPLIWRANSIENGRTVFQKESIDLLLLDLNLNGMNGFELLKDALAESFQTIIVSAYRDQAIKAFEHGVLDFVPKPVDKLRLRTALERFMGRGALRPETKYLALNVHGKVKYISVSDIRYVQGANVSTEIFLQDGTSLPYEKSLARTLQLLEPKFARIHRSYLVNIKQIYEITSTEGSRYWVVLKTGETLPVGRTRVSDLRSLLKDRDRSFEASL